MNDKYHPPTYWVDGKQVSKRKWRAALGKPGKKCKLVMKEKK